MKFLCRNSIKWMNALIFYLFEVIVLLFWIYHNWCASLIFTSLISKAMQHFDVNKMTSLFSSVFSLPFDKGKPSLYWFFSLHKHILSYHFLAPGIQLLNQIFRTVKPRLEPAVSNLTWLFPAVFPSLWCKDCSQITSVLIQVIFLHFLWSVWGTIQTNEGSREECVLFLFLKSKYFFCLNI